MAEFANYAVTPSGGITVTLTSSVTVGSIVFNSSSTVPITLDMVGSINLQVGPASNADGITLNTAGADVTINGPTQSYRFGSNTVGNLNVGANRTLTMNTPLAGSSATRDPRKVGTGTLVVGATGTGNASNAVRMFQMTDGYLTFGIDGPLSGSTTTINFSGGTLAAIGASRAVTNNYAITGNIAFDGTQSLTLSGSGSMTADRTISVHAPSADLTLGGGLGGAGFGLIKAGSGTLRINGTSTYNSFTAIDAGTLSAGANGALGGTVFVGNGATTGTAAALNLGKVDGGMTLTNTISINPGNGMNRTLSGANTSGTNTYSGLVQMDGSFGENRSIRVIAESAGGTLAFSNVISGAGQNVTKLGPGRVVFSGNNTYSGATTVEAGTLLINGTHTGGAAYTVKTGGTLGGSGNTGAAVTVESGGTLAPGNSIGVLTVSAIDLDPGSTYAVEVNTTAGNEAGDRTNVSGTGGTTLGDGVTFPALQFVFTPGVVETYALGKAFVIVQNTDPSATITGRFAGPTPVSGVQTVVDGLLQYAVYYGTYSGTIYGGGVNSGGNDIVVEFTSVPEPGAATALALSAATLLRRRRGA